MTRRVSLSIEQWIALREGGGSAPPIWFTVTGGSMRPLIRVNRDQVMLVSVDPKDIKVGDIVLFPGHFRGGDYCLHRVYRLEGDRVQTFGDGNPRPDAWFPRSHILGRAKLIRRGNLLIDCDDPKWQKRAALWCALWRIRPLLMLPWRAVDKLAREIKKSGPVAETSGLDFIWRKESGIHMETQDLIYLVVCAVNGEQPDPERVAAMDMDAVYDLASRHYLAAAAAPALKAAGVEEPRFIKAGRSSVLKNSTMDMDMEALFPRLEAAGIWHMPLKGTLLQHLYPVYGMRQMSDHDILFDASRAEEVRSIMEEMGFSVKEFDKGDHDVYYKAPVSNFELHRALFGPTHDEKLCDYYQKVQERLLGEGFEKHLSPEDFYLYMIAHEYKHYYLGGTGLRSLLDTYVYLQKVKLDMDYVAAEAEKLGLTEFEAANRSLARHIFAGEELTEADREMLAYILSSGVYGTMDHRVENKMAKKGYGKLQYALHRFFVPISRKNREYISFARAYPFFYRHKFLLPLLPFYRTIRALKSGRFKVEARAIKNVKR